jgi:hypothetical protein
VSAQTASLLFEAGLDSSAPWDRAEHAAHAPDAAPHAALRRMTRTPFVRMAW